MKNSIQTKKQHPNQKAQAKPIAMPGKPTSGFRWVILAACMLLGAAGTWALFEYVIWNTMPPELVGKWVVVGGEQDGATFDFYRNGRMHGRVNMQGQLGFVDATIRVEDNKMYSTTKHPRPGEMDTRVQVIRKITPRELVLEDEQRKLLKLERAQ